MPFPPGRGDARALNGYSDVVISHEIAAFKCLELVESSLDIQLHEPQ